MTLQKQYTALSQKKIVRYTTYVLDTKKQRRLFLHLCIAVAQNLYVCENLAPSRTRSKLCLTSATNTCFVMK